MGTESEIHALRSSIQTLEYKVTDLQNALSDKNTQIARLEQQIGELQTIVENKEIPTWDQIKNEINDQILKAIKDLKAGLF